MPQIFSFIVNHHGTEHAEPKSERMSSTFQNIHKSNVIKRAGASHKYVETGLFMDPPAYKLYYDYFKNSTGYKTTKEIDQ